MKNVNNTKQSGRDIVIHGACTNNLKNISLVIPEHKLTVITGRSGSGKSSLAFQTLYAEGQNRFVECLNTYTRQFIQTSARPDVELIQNIRPAVAIKQENRTRSGRATVGTASEINDYLRLLFARIGRTFCSQCGEQVKEHTKEEILKYILFHYSEQKIALVFPIRESGLKEISDIEQLGFQRVILQEKEVLFSDLKKKNFEDAYVVFERLRVHTEKETRIAEAVEQSLHYGKGYIGVYLYDEKKVVHFSDQFQCDTCHISYQKPQPQFFSFNSPLGACPTCKGYGDQMIWDMDKIVPDKGKSVMEGAVDPLTKKRLSWEKRYLYKEWKKKKVDLDSPYRDLSEVDKAIIKKDMDEVFAYLETKKYKMHVRVFISFYRSYVECNACLGTRLRPEVRHVKIGNMHIGELLSLPLDELEDFFVHVKITKYEQQVAYILMEETIKRIQALRRVGLSYMMLKRRINTLSGGEAQRLRLATVLRLGLSDILYVLDEPTIGLHARDTKTLIQILEELRDLGNTVVVVEHDEEVMKAADHIIDIGPESGERGGSIVFEGDWMVLKGEKDSLTAQYLLGEKNIERAAIEERDEEALHVKGITRHNVEEQHVEIPLERLTVIAGISGSGKSTLMDVLYQSLTQPDDCPYIESIKGGEYIEQTILINQDPIGKTPRSTPVTYMKFLDPIRRIFAKTEEAEKLGLPQGHFSYNTKDGQCPHCEGHGEVTEEMYFLNDIRVTCEFCQGKRFQPETLLVTYRGYTIADILDMTVTEAKEFFQGEKKIQKCLTILEKVGLGYVRLGQSALTFSGGEAQRFKVASSLVTQKKQDQILYLLDEPTTGLHFQDIQVLLNVLSELVDEGATVVVVEHNLDIIRHADWLIELGPEGGKHGGKVIYQGRIEGVYKEKGSVIKEYLSN